MVKVRPPPRLVIVPEPRSRRWPLAWRVALAGAWIASLVGAWYWAGDRAAPELRDARKELEATRKAYALQTRELERLRQREAILARSDQISRTANREVQRALTEREAEIANLRENLAFYERLVGATGQPKGLHVHSTEFQREAGGTWRYQVTLTQSLNRGAISSGTLRLSIEGVRDGKLATLDWGQLHQRPDAPPQRYSFRYFQQIEGSVMLPADFTPQRVRVSLSGDGAPVEQTFAWQGQAVGADTRVATFH